MRRGKASSLSSVDARVEWTALHLRLVQECRHISSESPLPLSPQLINPERTTGAFDKRLS